MAPPRAAIRAQAQTVIDDWSIPSTVSRFIATTDLSGKKTGSFVTQVSNELIWIQPISGNSDIREQGLNDETTHLAFQKHSGFALVAKDRILQSGGVYEFDVLRALIFESHRMAELKLVRRSD
jgi:hypothetical protein